MADSVMATQAYQAAARIREASQSIQVAVPDPKMGVGSFSGASFGDFLTQDLKETRRSIEKSEDLVHANLVGDVVDPVGSAMALQEATHRVERTTKALERLVNAYNDLSKMNI